MKVYSHAGFIFDVVGQIGRGGFGVVFEVRIRGLDKPYRYALKKFAPSDGVNHGTGAPTSLTEEGLLARFWQEVRYQSTCQHDNIVKILVFSTESGFFVMDLADNDLDTLIKEGSLSREDKIKALMDMLRGLEYLHEVKGLLHRDIKPSNVLKFRDVYKLSDFGLIKSIDGSNPKDIKTSINVRFDSEYYTAPEIHWGLADSSKQSDIYSLGVVMNELRLPGLERVANKCTMHMPVARYNSVSEIIVDVKKALGI